MSFFGKPSGGEPRITYERIDLSAASVPTVEDGMPIGSARGTPDRLEPKMERPKPGQTAVGQPAGVMLVAADSEVEGRLRSRGVVRVEGVLRGNVQAPVLLIEAGGLVEGGVTAERVRVCGALRGSVTAREIEVIRTAMVDAELIYDEISIERGARISGVHRQRDPEPAPETPPPATAPDLAQPDSMATETVVLATAAASTAVLVAEAEAALQSLAQATQAAAEAVADLAEEGVTELVQLENELRATPQTMLAETHEA